MSEVSTETKGKANASLLIRGALWIAIGALIAAALVCVVWVLIGDQDGIIGRAFLTILLLAAFAGIAILEAGLAPKRPDWLALASMITWIVALLVGAIKIWLPEEPEEYAGGVARFFMLLLVIGVLQLALLHVRLFTPAAKRYVTTFTKVIYYVTLGVLVLLVAMLVIYLTLPDTLEYSDLYWRIVVALAILAAVGTTLIPLLNALFAPKKNPAVPEGHAPQGYASAPAIAAPVAQRWPTYADGATPLPVLPDGSPDWNAYYTGYPTVPQQYPAQPEYSAQPEYPAQPEYQAQPPTPFEYPGQHQAAFPTPQPQPEAPAEPSRPQAGLTSSPDAPIGPDGLPVPPAGAPAAPDGTPGDPAAASEPAPQQTAPNVPPVPSVPPRPTEPPATTEPPAPSTQPTAPGAFPPPPPPAPPQ